MITILDNTVISNFARIRRVDLLTDAFPLGCVTTESVLKELQAGIAQGHLPADLNYQSILVVELEEREMTHLADTIHLGQGEWSCIVVAESRGYMFASDDLDARREAHRRGILTSGTIRGLLVLVRRKAISLEEANQMLAGWW
ncbi:MAG: DUF3368 domain-containing protein [Anaerolineae bacterium]|nr:DUF3368 domain-containing protein [Anaerolineae bacterium]